MRGHWRVIVAVVVLVAGSIGLVLWIYDPGRDDVNWGDVPSYIPFVALLIAALGLNTWWNQLRGTHDFDLARRTLKAVYSVRDAVQAVRAPYMDASEGAEKPADSDVPWEAYAYQGRWRPVLEAESELRLALLEAEVIWGAEFLHQEGADLRIQRHRLWVLIRKFVRVRQRGSDEDLSQEETEALYAISDDDEFSTKVREAVEGFEAKLRPKLRRSWGPFR